MHGSQSAPMNEVNSNRGSMWIQDFPWGGCQPYILPAFATKFWLVCATNFLYTQNTFHAEILFRSPLSDCTSVLNKITCTTFYKLEYLVIFWVISYFSPKTVRIYPHTHARHLLSYQPGMRNCRLDCFMYPRLQQNEIKINCAWFSFVKQSSDFS